MIKQTLFLVLVCCGATVGSAQTSPVRNPQDYVYPGNPNNNQPGVGGLMFSNRVGQTFSANDLASQLQNLRSSVDQTLPLLSAFNENYSNSVTGNRQTVGRALSGIVSGVLERNQPAGQNNGGNQSALGATNLLALLHGLLSTNTTGAVSAAPSNAEDLKVLETDLQSVVAVLQRLNVSPAPNQYSAPYNNGAVPMPNPNPSLTPTGR